MIEFVLMLAYIEYDFTLGLVTGLILVMVIKTIIVLRIWAAVRRLVTMQNQLQCKLEILEKIQKMPCNPNPPTPPSPSDLTQWDK